MQLTSGLGQNSRPFHSANEGIPATPHFQFIGPGDFP
jgi:hypothetical protein